jgi:hypothetical protein
LFTTGENAYVGEFKLMLGAGVNAVTKGANTGAKIGDNTLAIADEGSNSI